MVYFRYFPLNPLQKMPALGITLSPAALLLDVPSCTVSSQPRGLRVLPALGYFLKWVFILLMVVSFTGCATSTTTHRTPAKVEDRTASPETAPPAPVQEEPSARVYKLEEPEYVPPQPLPDTEIEEQSIELEPEVSPEQSVELSSSSSPAVVALLNDADQYVVTGKNQEAVASIERAIRIEPKNPVLWHKLGKVRLQEGKWDQAIATAKKSNVLAAGNRLLQSENWMIIAKAKEGQGDVAGATHAMDTARQLRTY
jgi:hypothetical protein